MRASGSTFLFLILLAICRPALAGNTPKILGELRTSTTADSLHVDFDVFINDRVDSLVLDFWEPARIFDVRDSLAGSAAETLQVKSLFIRGDDGLYTQRLRGRQSWPRNDRGNPSRIWLEYWGGVDPESEGKSKRKFWEFNEFSLGFTLQPLIIIGSSFSYHDPGIEGLEKQSSYRESQYLGLHVNYGRLRLTLAEGGAAGHFFGEADSTQQKYEFLTGMGPYLRYDLGNLRGFRPIVGAGWHRFDLQMRGPLTEEPVTTIERKEDGFGVTVGVADPAGTLTYSFLDMDHYRHRVSLSVPVMGFKRTTFGTRIDYVEVDGRPAWKTHFVIDFSTPLRPKDGPLVTPEAITWTWRNYAALAVAAAAEPILVVGAAAYLVVKGVGALF